MNNCYVNVNAPRSSALIHINAHIQCVQCHAFSVGRHEEVRVCNEAEHSTLQGRAVMYIVCRLLSHHESEASVRACPQGVCGPALRCTVLPPLQAPTRLVAVNVSDNCAASHYANQQQNLVTDTRCARYGRYELELLGRLLYGVSEMFVWPVLLSPRRASLEKHLLLVISTLVYLILD